MSKLVELIILLEYLNHDHRILGHGSFLSLTMAIKKEPSKKSKSVKTAFLHVFHFGYDSNILRRHTNFGCCVCVCCEIMMRQLQPAKNTTFVSFPCASHFSLVVFSEDDLQNHAFHF